MDLDPRRIDLREFHVSEDRSKSLEGVLVHFVCLERANRRLRVVLDKKICPLAKRESLALPYRGERVIVSGVKALTKLPLRFLPVFCVG
jgi:hypothetical protein